MAARTSQAGRCVLVLALLLTFAAGVAAAIPLEGTLDPSEALEAHGVMTLAGYGREDLVAAWSPDLSRGDASLDAARSLLTLQEVRWLSRPAERDEPGRPSAAAGLYQTFRQIDMVDPRLRITSVDASARWALVGDGPAEVRVGPAAACLLRPADAEAVSMTAAPAMVVETTAWEGRGTPMMAAHCDAARVEASGSSRLMIVGSSLQVSFRDPVTRAASSVSIETGLVTRPAPDDPRWVENVYRQATFAFSGAGGAWRLPGARDVWMQSADAQLAGSLRIPGSRGALTWGDETVVDPRLALEPSGTFQVTASHGDGLSIRGDASNAMRNVAVGAGLVAAAAAVWRYGLPPLQLLFTRLREDTVLDHPRRRALVDLVLVNPGVRPQQAATALGLTRRAVDYHVGVLCRQGILVRRRFGGTTALFPAGSGSSQDHERIHRLRQPSLQRAYRLLEAADGLSQAQLARHLGLSQPRVSAILSELRRLGLVLSRRAGRRTTYALRRAGA